MQADLRLGVNFFSVLARLTGKPTHSKLRDSLTHQVSVRKQPEKPPRNHRSNNPEGFLKGVEDFSVRNTHKQNYFMRFYDFPSKLKDKTLEQGKISTEEERLILLARPPQI